MPFSPCIYSSSISLCCRSASAFKSFSYRRKSERENKKCSKITGEKRTKNKEHISSLFLMILRDPLLESED
ncbi:hypothetical protein BDV28DRAFT_138067 [Aspergillus coremiiformis]|uniref:Uncharacterized protein n=1 Tax=Aspergillus coremiiformis TaxID=138285 RepID=A0A5N6YZW3_9EURO|nr:hypothetical protein BDV28DRAFT_138067 [Aspergillus coremiiformis]